MKQFDVPEFYRSNFIGKVKAHRKANDPRKKDFSPSILNFGNLELIIPRHFGFCYGVENAIEIAYRAVEENPGKRIYLLSQMIHNPTVNADLNSRGIDFIMDTEGNQLIDWDQVSREDVVIIPAFGTTIAIEELLDSKGIEVQKYNTTCPFVEKVWNRSYKLGKDDFSVVIHGKPQHEETRATFSHSNSKAASIVIKDMSEAHILGEFITGKRPISEFDDHFKGRYSDDFDPAENLRKLGVVNQTTMLASETQAIADHIKSCIIEKFGSDNYKDHFADTRDTLCYATNDNQSATKALLDYEADAAFVIGGYNSSNTSHLLELLEDKFKCFYIDGVKRLEKEGKIDHFLLHEKKNVITDHSLGDFKRIIITSGASCPDAVVDEVIEKILEAHSPIQKSVDQALNELLEITP